MTPLGRRSLAGLGFVLALAARAAAAPWSPGCPPECTPPAARSGASPHAPGRWYPGFAMRTLALRGASERTRLNDATTSDGTVAVDESALAYINKGPWSARYTDLFTLGGGSAGLEGGLAADAAVGLRAELGRSHGPFFRVGFRAEWRRRGRYHASLLELPQLQLGYSLLRGRFQADVGARAGIALVGRFGLDGAAVRRLGGAPEIGSYVALGVFPVRVEAEIGQAAPSAAPVSRFDALVCGAIEMPRVCVRAEWLSGSVRASGEPSSATARSIGLTLGFGALEWR